jgi:hypothetical protein
MITAMYAIVQHNTYGILVTELQNKFLQKPWYLRTLLSIWYQRFLHDAIRNLNTKPEHYSGLNAIISSFQMTAETGGMLNFIQNEETLKNPTNHFPISFHKVFQCDCSTHTKVHVNILLVNEMQQKQQIILVAFNLLKKLFRLKHQHVTSINQLQYTHSTKPTFNVNNLGITIRLLQLFIRIRWTIQGSLVKTDAYLDKGK